MTSWEGLLEAPGAGDHLVQLYTDEEFLFRAIARFVARGIARRDGVVMIATPEHVEGVVRRLTAGGVDLDAALGRGQFVVLDAETSLSRLMVAGRPDRGRFLALTSEVVARVREAGYPAVRLYGEMVDLLWQRDLPAAIQLEELWNEVLAAEGVSLLCAYGIDNFDRWAHRSAIPAVSRCHSHLIPVDDYDRLDRAVARAYEDTFGSLGEAAELRGLVVDARRPPVDVPAGQRALMALRELSAPLADAVLLRARDHYRRG